MRVVVSTHAFAPDQELASFTCGGEAGAVASFVGYCRAEGGAVERLELEHYPGFTEAAIRQIAEAAFQRHGLIDLLVIHRVGTIAAGEAIVLVAASSAHRLNALTAVSEVMDYLKTEAPIWKKEVGKRGETWVEPELEDYRAAARWRDQGTTIEFESPPPRGGRGRGGGERPLGDEPKVVADVADLDSCAASGRVIPNGRALSPHPLTPSPSRGGGEEEPLS